MLGALACAIGAILACTGESPDLEGPTRTPDATSARPIDDGASAVEEDALTESDAGPDVDAGLTECDGGFFDTKNNPNHCGACGHDCVGGECVDGQCQPVTIIDNVAGPYGVTTGGSAVVWVRAEGDGGAVESCPLSGCAGPPQLLTDRLVPPYEPAPRAATIVSNGLYVWWIAGRQNVGTGTLNHLFGCVASACTFLYEIRGGDGTTITRVTRVDSLLIYRTLEGMHNSCNIERCDNPYAITGAGSGSIAFAVEPRRLFYEDHAGGPVVDGGRLDRVFRCDSNLDAGCFDVAPMFVAADVSFLGVSGDTLYAVANGELLACSVDGCTNAPEVLVKDLGEVSAFVVDDKYAYIARPGERGTKTGSIVACALPKCAGGLRTLASGLAFPNSLHIADGVLYWSNAGDGPGSGSIQKVRP